MICSVSIENKIMPLNLRCSSLKFLVISNCYKRPIQSDHKAAKNRQMKEMLTIHFKIIISWDWLNRFSYFLGYELVVQLEVSMSDKERIRVVESLV